MRKKLGPFPLGVNNRRHPSDLETVVERRLTDLLAAADNVDLVDDGSLRRREGYAREHEGGFHSLWGDGGEWGYVVRGTDLLAVSPSGSLQLVQEGMAPGMPVSYTRFNGLVLWTNGLRIGLVRDTEPVLPTPPVLTLPAVTAAADGSLDAGQYQLALTLFGPAGEGPACEPFVLDISAGGAIDMAGITAPDGFELRAYMTGPNGSVFNRAELVEFSGRGRIATQADTGGEATTIGKLAMPAGSIARIHGGRLLMAQGNVLIYSEPFAPLLTDPGRNFITLEAPITVVRPCGAGTFVATTQATYWLAGDVAQAPLVEVLPYGAVEGSDSVDPSAQSVVFWVSSSGLVRGSADGTAVNVQEANLSLAGGSRAATYVRERQGQSHVVTSTQNPQATRGGVVASIDAEIIRRS